MRGIRYLGITLALLFITAARSEENSPTLQGCVAGVGRDRQRECDRQVFNQIGSTSSVTTLDGGWQLVRTKSPSGGPDAVSVMHVADWKKSDIGLAGLSLQCSQQGIEVILITLERMSRTDRPQVTLRPGTGQTVEFEASAVQAGDALLLPRYASELALGGWTSATELSVDINGKPTPIRGIIPIGGLGAAVRVLVGNCPAR